MGAVWYLATGFTKSRIGTASAYAAMEQYHRTKPSQKVELLTQDTPGLQFAVLNLSYLPVTLTTFSYYYDLPASSFSGPNFGQYNFTGPVTFAMRRAGFRDDQKTLQDIRSEATRDLRMRGYGDNVWSTAIRDVAFDFGWWGAPIALFFVGWISQGLLQAAGRRGSGVFLAMAPLAALFLTFSVAHSLFVLENYAVSFYICLVALVFEGILKRHQAKLRPAVAMAKTSTAGQIRARVAG